MNDVTIAMGIGSQRTGPGEVERALKSITTNIGTKKYNFTTKITTTK